MSQPTVNTLLDAAQSAFHVGATPTSDLVLFTDSTGQPMTVTSANGCSATAYEDASGNVIIGFQPTSNSIQDGLDQKIISGQAPSTIAGLSDAMTFANQVQAVATADGIASSNIYTTGFSLGGALAEYVASQTGFGGAALAGCGLPTENNASPASNFVSYVESGDPFSNFATDTGESALAKVNSTHFDHYGTVVKLGDAAGYTSITALVKATQLLPWETLIGHGAQQQAIINQDYANGMTTYHSFPKYVTDIKAIPSGSPGAYTGPATLSSSLTGMSSSLADIARSETVGAGSGFLSSAGLSAAVPASAVGGSARIVDVGASASLHDGMASTLGHSAITLIHAS